MYISKKFLAVIGVLIAAALLVGIGFAQGNDDVIHACVNPEQQIRIVDAPEGCRDEETNLNWNVQGIPGEDGEDGDDGEDGEPGEPGPPGFVPFYRIVSDNVQVEPGVPEAIRAYCDPGDRATGGGYSMGGEVEALHVFYAYPSFDHYELGAYNIGQFAIGVRAIVVCADITP